MKTSAFRFAVGVALLAFGPTFAAHGQVFGSYPIIIVPPAQNYLLPKPAPKAQAPDGARPAAAPADAAPIARYQGRTMVQDR